MGATIIVMRIGFCMCMCSNECYVFKGKTNSMYSNEFRQFFPYTENGFVTTTFRCGQVWFANAFMYINFTHTMEVQVYFVAMLNDQAR